MLYSYYSKLSRLRGGNIDFNENLGVNFELKLCLQFIILPVFSLVVFVLLAIVIAATDRHFRCAGVTHHNLSCEVIDNSKFPSRSYFKCSDMKRMTDPFKTLTV